ncbi:hypothetical protein [Thiohalorhabdus methylotrophus]|uniref:Uncharacterized protein n=1 Tax=Thiohalorhabdus methylotrophus TaxID=3242694 RepID=A0ABV4TQV6_9GAMM
MPLALPGQRQVKPDFLLNQVLKSYASWVAQGVSDLVGAPIEGHGGDDSLAWKLYPSRIQADIEKGLKPEDLLGNGLNLALLRIPQVSPAMKAGGQCPPRIFHQMRVQG